MDDQGQANEVPVSALDLGTICETLAYIEADLQHVPEHRQAAALLSEVRRRLQSQPKACKEAASSRAHLSTRWRPSWR